MITKIKYIADIRIHSHSLHKHKAAGAWSYPLTSTYCHG